MKFFFLLLSLIALTSCSPKYVPGLYQSPAFEGFESQSIQVLPLIDARTEVDKDRSEWVMKSADYVLKKRRLNYRMSSHPLPQDSSFLKDFSTAFEMEDCSGLLAYLPEGNEGLYLLLRFDELEKEVALSCNYTADFSAMLFNASSGELLMKNKGVGSWSAGFLLCGAAAKDAISQGVLDLLSPFQKSN